MENLGHAQNQFPLIQSSFAIWHIDPLRCEMKSDNRLQHLPSQKIKGWSIFYFIFAMIFSFFFLGAYHMSSEFLANLSDIFHWDFNAAYTDSPQKFIVKSLVLIFTPIIAFLTYFWPLLLSIRSPKIIFVENGILKCEKKEFHSADGAEILLRRKLITTRHGAGSEYAQSTTSSTVLTDLEINTKGGKWYHQSFSKESFDALKNFFQTVHYLTGIPFKIEL